MKFHALLLARFDIDSQTFVKFLSLLLELSTGLFSIQNGRLLFFFSWR